MRFLSFLAGLGLVSCTSASIEPLTISSITSDPVSINEDFPPAIAELAIDSAGSRMNGHMYLADGPGPHPTVVMLHGFPGNERSLDLAQAFRRSGWNALFFHYRGAWGSAGDFSFASAMDDVGAAVAFLRDPANENLRVDAGRIALIGHSMGGMMALQGGARDEGIRCIAGMAAANLGDNSLLANASPAQLEGFKQYADTMIMLNGFTGEGAIAELLTDNTLTDNKDLAPALAGKNVFLIAAERDQAVDISVHEAHMRAYLNAGDIQLTELRLDTDHSFSWYRIRLASELTNWLNRECR